MTDMKSTNTLKQFFTHDYKALLPILDAYPIDTSLVVDPFAGDGHLLKLFECATVSIDIDPTVKPDIVADSFINIPVAGDFNVVTNPPYCYQHILRCENPALAATVRDAGYVDLYEYAIRRVIDLAGFRPIYAILPENFIASRQARLRRELCKHIAVVQVHTRSLCADTDQPTIFVKLTPDTVAETDLWIDDKPTTTIVITPDGLQPNLKVVGNHVDFGIRSGQTDEQRDTSILLKAVDGGSAQNRIRLMSVCEQFPGQQHLHHSTRTHIQVVPNVAFTDRQVRLLKRAFNEWVDRWRTDTHGLGLTSFRGNANGFRRKRIDFKLARLVINNLIERLLSGNYPK